MALSNRISLRQGNLWAVANPKSGPNYLVLITK
jgi:hypothetical protein